VALAISRSCFSVLGSTVCPAQHAPRARGINVYCKCNCSCLFNQAYPFDDFFLCLRFDRNDSLAIVFLNRLEAHFKNVERITDAVSSPSDGTGKSASANSPSIYSASVILPFNPILYVVPPVAADMTGRASLSPKQCDGVSTLFTS